MALHNQKTKRTAVSSASSTKESIEDLRRCPTFSYGFNLDGAKYKLCWGSCLLLSVTLLLSCCSGMAEGKHAWERPGCHKVGKSEKLEKFKMMKWNSGAWKAWNQLLETIMKLLTSVISIVLASFPPASCILTPQSLQFVFLFSLWMQFGNGYMYQRTNPFIWISKFQITVQT